MLPISIILTEGYSDWEIGLLSGIGRSFYGAAIRFVSPEGCPVVSAGGLSIAATARFALSEQEVIVVCGGPAFETEAPPDLNAKLRGARDAGCIIAGICGGTIALARAGLLNDVRHTSNGPGYLDAHVAGYAGKANYVDQPMALRAGNIITAPAPAPASFAAEVLSAAGLEQRKADEIKRMLSAEHEA